MELGSDREISAGKDLASLDFPKLDDPSHRNIPPSEYERYKLQYDHDYGVGIHYRNTSVDIEVFCMECMVIHFDAAHLPTHCSHHHVRRFCVRAAIWLVWRYLNAAATAPPSPILLIATSGNTDLCIQLYTLSGQASDVALDST